MTHRRKANVMEMGNKIVASVAMRGGRAWHQSPVVQMSHGSRVTGKAAATIRAEAARSNFMISSDGEENGW